LPLPSSLTASTSTSTSTSYLDSHSPSGALFPGVEVVEPVSLLSSSLVNDGYHTPPLPTRMQSDSTSSFEARKLPPLPLHDATLSLLRSDHFEEFILGILHQK
jgi:hypothetical protein